MLKNYKLQQSAITLTVILSLTFNIIKTEQVKSCQYNQSVFDLPMVFEQEIIDEIDHYIIKGDGQFESKTWQIQDIDNHMKEMFSDQILTMQAFDNQSDILQLEQGTCYIAKNNGEPQIDVKIVTRSLQFNLEQYLNQQGSKVNQTLIIDIIFKILVAVRKMHANGFLHLNLNSKSIQFTSNQQLVLSNMEFAMPKYRSRNFQYNQDSYVAPEIYGQNQSYIYTEAADVYSLCYLFQEILQKTNLKNAALIKDFYDFLSNLKQMEYNERNSTDLILPKLYKLICKLFSSKKDEWENNMEIEQEQIQKEKDRKLLSQQESSMKERQIIYEHLIGSFSNFNEVNSTKDLKEHIDKLCKIQQKKDLNKSSQFAFVGTRLNRNILLII